MPSRTSTDSDDNMARHFKKQTAIFRDDSPANREHGHQVFDHVVTRADYERFAGAQPYETMRSLRTGKGPLRQKKPKRKLVIRCLISGALVALLLVFISVGVSLARFYPLVPYLRDMLGLDGSTRNYLLIAQNNAELRATGGLAGSWTLISATKGDLEKGDSLTLQHSGTIDYDWTDEELSNFPIVTKDDPSGVNFTPDFQRAGSRFALAYETNTGVTIDGVIAIDPVFLQRIIAVIGGVTTSDGTTIDGSNAAKVLESDTYWRYANNDAQDAFFAEVASLTFSEFSDDFNILDVLPLIDVINRSIDDHHLQVWLADSEEESAAQDAGMAGEVSLSRDKPVLGVYVNDNTWGKIDWYLQVETRIDTETHNQDGSVSYQVQTTLTNTGSNEMYDGAPGYVSGFNSEKTDKSDMILYPLLVAPAGGTIIDLEFSDGTGAEHHTLYGLDSWTRRVDLTAQQSVTATYTVTTSSEADKALVIRSTPLGTDDEES